MMRLKKNKTIIIGKSGVGKTFMALTLGLKNKGTAIICNGCVDKSYYENSFPCLKDFQTKNGDYNFNVEEGGKYYICAKNCSSATEFVNTLIFGCDYGNIGIDKKAIIIYDDNAWIDSKNNLLTLWQLSHMKCKIIITADSVDSIYNIFKIDKNDLTKGMIKDILKYWNIIKL